MGNTHTARRHRHSESDSNSKHTHIHTAKKHHRRARHSRRHRIRKQHGGFNWMFWKKDEAPAVDGAPAAQPLSVDMVEEKLQNFTKESKEGVTQGLQNFTETAKEKATGFSDLFKAKPAEVAPAAAPAQGGGRRRKGRKTIRKRKRSGHKH